MANGNKNIAPDPLQVLVFIPAYEEEAKIGEIVRKAKKYVKDVLVINDASKDSTAKKAREAGAIVITHPYNLGYGGAIQTGCKYACDKGYDVLIHLDADGQHDPDDIPRFLQAINNFDICIGSRFMRDVGGGYKVPLLRKIGNKLFSYSAQLITGQTITDSTSGYRALSHKAIEFCASERCPGEFYDADMLIAASQNGCTLTNIPVRMYANDENKSMHKGIFKSIYYIMRMSVGILCTALQRK
ncbi:MAG: glycosyltransferase family 2 protein [Desulfovibrio sp.]|nr:glycosyltransferase family 2 protein [Desulfovibrio sp.]